MLAAFALVNTMTCCCFYAPHPIFPSHNLAPFSSHSQPVPFARFFRQVGRDHIICHIMLYPILGFALFLPINMALAEICGATGAIGDGDLLCMLCLLAEGVE